MDPILWLILSALIGIFAVALGVLVALVCPPGHSYLQLVRRAHEWTEREQ